jgi:hypothetical protein
MPGSIDYYHQGEFGTLEWCLAASRLGVALIERAGLDLGRYEWGFSEEYTNLPERLRGGREKPGYHLMIHNGKVSGGASIPEECLALPGFHVVVEWALIAHASYLPFNIQGREDRVAAQSRLAADLLAAGKGPRRDPGTTLARTAPRHKVARCPACGSRDHDREDCRVWPPGVGESLAANPNNTRWLIRSPELEGLPETEWGVPIFTDMTDDQKARFLHLLGR